jgi:hypothetical protein
VRNTESVFSSILQRQGGSIEKNIIYNFLSEDRFPKFAPILTPAVITFQVRTVNPGKEELTKVKNLKTGRVLQTSYLSDHSMPRFKMYCCQSSPELFSFSTTGAGLELRKGLSFELLDSSLRRQRPPLETMQRLSSLQILECRSSVLWAEVSENHSAIQRWHYCRWLHLLK